MLTYQFNSLFNKILKFEVDLFEARTEKPLTEKEAELYKSIDRNTTSIKKLLKRL